jgi:hypothetical protein
MPIARAAGSTVPNKQPDVANRNLVHRRIVSSLHTRRVLCMLASSGLLACAQSAPDRSDAGDSGIEHVHDGGRRAPDGSFDADASDATETFDAADALFDAHTVEDASLTDASDAGDAGDEGPDARILPEPTVEEFLEGYEKAGCEWIKRCWGINNCVGDIGAMDFLRELRATVPSEVEGGRLGFHAQQAARCLARRARCGDEPPHNLPECHDIFYGRVKLGDDCYYPNTPSECAVGVCDACPGHCASVTDPDQKGDACNDRSCAQGLGCRPVNNTHYECVEIVGSGEPCSSTVQCEDGLYCSDGTCADRIALGAACSFDFACGPDRVCRYVGVGSDKVCVREVALGDSCQDILSGCNEGSYCDLTGGRATCRAVATLGEDCAIAPCKIGLLCNMVDSERVCQALPELGEKCSGDNCQYPLQCTDGLCSKGLDVGSDCSSLTDCDQGLFCALDGTCKKQSRKWEACELDSFNSCASLEGECVQVQDGDSLLEQCVPNCTGPGTTTQHF